MNGLLKYTDRNGMVETIIKNDSKNLSAHIRGVIFTGVDFDSLKPEKYGDEKKLEAFTLCEGNLCDCRIEWTIEVPMCTDKGVEIGKFSALLELGSPRGNGGLDKETLALRLKYSDKTVASKGVSGWFEDELLDLQKKLPERVYMKMCFNCLYSDYSIYGHGLFGGMMCFRNLKQEYLKVQSKDDFFNIHERYDRLVQETFLCDEFEKRVDGTGYRG